MRARVKITVVKKLGTRELCGDNPPAHATFLPSPNLRWPGSRRISASGLYRVSSLVSMARSE